MSDPAKFSPLFEIARTELAQNTEMGGWSVPIAFGGREVEVAAARQGVVMADRSADGKIRIEGASAAHALGLTSVDIHSGAEWRDNPIYRLRADLLFMFTEPGGAAEAMSSLSALTEGAAELLTVTDVTHGKTHLRLVGPKSAELLGRLCGIDFSSAAFPDNSAQQSSVAKTAQIIIRKDLDRLPAYSLIGLRSLGDYLWHVVAAAGEDLGIAFAGLDALEELGG